MINLVEVKVTVKLLFKAFAFNNNLNFKCFVNY